MKRKEKRQAFSLKCPNCLIESGLAYIQPKIPCPYRERAETSGPQFFFQTRAPSPILKATAIARGDKFRKCDRSTSIDSNSKKVFVRIGARMHKILSLSVIFKVTAIARGVSSENVIAVLVLIQIKKKCLSVTERVRTGARGPRRHNFAPIFLFSFSF